MVGAAAPDLDLRIEGCKPFLRAAEILFAEGQDGPLPHAEIHIFALVVEGRRTEHAVGHRGLILQFHDLRADAKGVHPFGEIFLPGVFSLRNERDTRPDVIDSGIQLALRHVVERLRAADGQHIQLPADLRLDLLHNVRQPVHLVLGDADGTVAAEIGTDAVELKARHAVFHHGGGVDHHIFGFEAFSAVTDILHQDDPVDLALL